MMYNGLVCKILTFSYASWREEHDMRYAGLFKYVYKVGTEITSTASRLQIIDGYPHGA